MPFKILNPHPKQQLTADDIEVRIWGFVVVVVTLILCFIVAAMLYSVIFVVQPIKSMAPIDQAFTKMLNDIVLLIVGGIGGVMSKRATKAVAQALAPEPPKSPAAASPQPQPQPQTPPGPTSVIPDWNWMGYKNPDLDESWVPPPPPTTPPDYVDPSVEEIAQERAAARSEA
jgi:hypothetical protein